MGGIFDYSGPTKGHPAAPNKAKGRDDWDDNGLTLVQALHKINELYRTMRNAEIPSLPAAPAPNTYQQQKDIGNFMFDGMVPTQKQAKPSGKKAGADAEPISMDARRLANQIAENRAFAAFDKQLAEMGIVPGQSGSTANPTGGGAAAGPQLNLNGIIKAMEAKLQSGAANPTNTKASALLAEIASKGLGLQPYAAGMSQRQYDDSARSTDATLGFLAALGKGLTGFGGKNAEGFSRLGDTMAEYTDAAISAPVLAQLAKGKLPGYAPVGLSAQGQKAIADRTTAAKKENTDAEQANKVAKMDAMKAMGTLDMQAQSLDLNKLALEMEPYKAQIQEMLTKAQLQNNLDVQGLRGQQQMDAAKLMAGAKADSPDEVLGRLATVYKILSENAPMGDMSEMTPDQQMLYGQHGQLMDMLNMFFNK